MIKELFDSLENAHSELASACSVLSWLSSTLKSTRLMTILEASIRPLIQIKTTAAFKLWDFPEKMSELPDDPEERVELLMMPNPAANTIKDEKINSPTRLLVATWAYRISNIFGKGTTQRKIQELYSILAKQLAACIMGRNIWGEQTGKEDYPALMKTLLIQETFGLIDLNTVKNNKHINSYQHHLWQTTSQPGEWWVAVVGMPTTP